MIMKKQLSKTYGMQQKQFNEGHLQKYNLTSIITKNVNQPKLTPKTTRERSTKPKVRKK